MRRPTTCLARPSRTVSTSGSSGTAPSRLVAVGAPGRQRLRQVVGLLGLSRPLGALTARTARRGAVVRPPAGPGPSASARVPASAGLAPFGDGGPGAVATGPGESSESTRQAASAARCSASFLLRPSSPPYRSPATITQAVNVFAWSGPASSIRYSGTPRLSAAVSSWRLVFQSSAAPRPADSAISGSNSRWITIAVGVQAVLQVDRAEQRLERVGEDARLVPAAGGLLALAEQQVRAQPVRARAAGPRRRAPAC